MKDKTRYDRIKEQDIADMAAFLSWYFDCSKCPAKKDGCSEDCSFCMDAIQEWLSKEGTL